MRYTLALLMVCTAMLALGSTATAQGAHGRQVGWPGAYYAHPYYPSDRRMPYFAEFPPVYYSYPVPRTYGHSPFAYPPSVRTPELKPAEPLMVPNPHVTPQPKAEPTSGRSAAAVRQIAPLRMMNPYYSQPPVVARQD